MVTTIDAAFKTLRSSLEITDLQEASVSATQANIRDNLKKSFVVLDDFLTGSYRRSTLIAPLSEADVDIFFVLDPKYYSQYGQGALLESVKKSLQNSYPQTSRIRPDGQAVTISFTKFKVDIVPAFYRQGGGYLIPGTTSGEWISTDPKRHIEIWADANKAHNGDLIPLIKMLKAWNKRSKAFKSFHLETVTIKVLSGITISDFPSGVRYVLDKARDHIRVVLPDPAGYSADVAAYVKTEAQMNEIVQKLAHGYGLAAAAEQLAAAGRTSDAFANWRTLFDNYFPAYG
jgi:hypothetical protein